MRRRRGSGMKVPPRGAGGRGPGGCGGAVERVAGIGRETIRANGGAVAQPVMVAAHSVVATPARHDQIVRVVKQEEVALVRCPVMDRCRSVASVADSEEDTAPFTTPASSNDRSLPQPPPACALVEMLPLNAPFHPPTPKPIPLQCYNITSMARRGYAA